MTRREIATNSSHPCAKRLRTLQWRKGAFNMTFRAEFRGSTILAAAIAPLAAMALSLSSATPARADRCDDIAGQLKNQIDGLKVGITAANVIYLSHPKARELSLGCASRNFSNELYAKADSRKA